MSAMSQPITAQPRTIVSVTVRALHLSAVTDMYVFTQIMGDSDLKTSLELAEHATDLLYHNHTGVQPDYENTVEDLFKLHAAVVAVGAENVVINHNNARVLALSPKATSPDNIVDLHTLLSLPDVHVFHVGGVSTNRNGVLFPRDTTHRYPTNSAIRAGLRRAFRQITVTEEDAHTAEARIIRTLMTMMEQSGDPFLLKVLEDKHPLLEVTLNDDVTQLLCTSDYFEFFDDWLMPTLSHRSTVTILVQEKITMHSEYRCFTKNGRVVTSAANIDHHTPLDVNLDTAPGCPDLRVQARRTSDGEILPITADTIRVVLAMHDFANLVAQGVYSNPSKDSPLDDYLCLDVAWDADNNLPVVVEVNPVAMSGLFATDVYRTGYLVDFIKHYTSNPDNRLTSVFAQGGFTRAVSNSSQL